MPSLMSFLGLEQAGGSPVELFVFQQGTNYWRYTDGQAPVTVNGLTYQPAVIARSQQVDSQERAQARITITLDRKLPVVSDMLMGNPFYRPATAAVFRFQPGATDKALIGRGRISSTRYRGTAVEVTITQAAALLQQPVPRLTYTAKCNHILYDAFCQMDPSLFTFNNVVTGVLPKNDPAGSPDGPAIQFNSLAATGGPPAVAAAAFGTAGYFAGGYFLADGQPVYVIAHLFDSATDTATLVLFVERPASVVVGVTLAVTAGCDHSYETCLQKFNNLKNFLGFPFMPTKNVYTQGLR